MLTFEGKPALGFYVPTGSRSEPLHIVHDPSHHAGPDSELHDGLGRRRAQSAGRLCRRSGRGRRPVRPGLLPHPAAIAVTAAATAAAPVTFR